MRIGFIAVKNLLCGVELRHTPMRQVNAWFSWDMKWWCFQWGTTAMFPGMSRKCG